MTSLVGILNLSPDSFSDGRIYTAESLRERIEKMIDDGADIIDVGGESTAPGSRPITYEEECERLDIFWKICETLSARINFSLDTKKSVVAEMGIQKGITMINDVSGGRADPAMWSVIAKYPHVKYVCMYSRNPDGHADLDHSKNPQDVMETLYQFFDTIIPAMQAAGIRREQIILDPGMGAFVSTDPMDSVRILGNIGTLKTRYNLPIFVGTSRKGFLAKIAPDHGPQDRLGSSLASSLYAMTQGAEYLRIHDAREMRQAVKVWEAMCHQDL